MTRNEVIELAKAAGIRAEHPSDFFSSSTVTLERFAELVAKHEREECAKFFEEHWRDKWYDEQICGVIRARGNA